MGNWLIFRFDWGIIVGVALVCFIEFVISSLGLFVWYREEFHFEKGEFIYIKAFGKKQTAKITDIAKVKLDNNENPAKRKVNPINPIITARIILSLRVLSLLKSWHA